MLETSFLLSKTKPLIDPYSNNQITNRRTPKLGVSFYKEILATQQRKRATKIQAQKILTFNFIVLLILKIEIMKNGSKFIGKITWVDPKGRDPKTILDSKNSDPKLQKRPILYGFSRFFSKAIILLASSFR